MLPTAPPTYEGGPIAQDEVAPAVDPTTPSDPRSNVGRKRLETPSLRRALPSPSHSSKMAAIFRDAQSSMHMATAPFHPAASSPRMTRMSLALHEHRGCDSPTSTRIGSRGSPAKSGEHQEPDDFKPLTRTESNKENQSPEHPYPATPTRTTLAQATEDSPPHSSTSLAISRLKGPTIPPRASSSPNRKIATDFHNSSATKGFLTQPPRLSKKHKLADGSSTTDSSVDDPFRIRPDADLDGIVPLSPDVTPYRKKNRPKLTRCSSYYDADLLGSPSASAQEESDGEYGTGDGGSMEVEQRKGKLVLGESDAARALTKQTAFVEEAQGAAFFGEREA